MGSFAEMYNAPLPPCYRHLKFCNVDNWVCPFHVHINIVRGFDCSTLSQTLIFHSVFNLVYVVLGM